MLFTNFDLSNMDKLDRLTINFQDGSQDSPLQSIEHLAKFANKLVSIVNILAQEKLTTAINSGDPEASQLKPEDWKNKITWEDVLTYLPTEKVKGGIGI